MKIALTIPTIAFAVLATTAVAHASPEHRAWREELRAMQQRPLRDQQDSRFIQRDESRMGSTTQSTTPDDQRKQAKMSAEERRALRRQINEAGRDLYTPTR